jgi:hypothetical protein
MHGVGWTAKDEQAVDDAMSYVQMGRALRRICHVLFSSWRGRLVLVLVVVGGSGASSY